MVNYSLQFYIEALKICFVNEKQTNALIIQCIVTQYSPTCFGILKCHHQRDKYNPA
jgi:hypothetical protein